MMFLDGRSKEAGHAVLGAAGCLSVEGACGDTGLLGTFRGGMTEEDDGANQLIGELFGKLREQVELVPVLSRFEAWTGESRHRHSQTIARGQHARRNANVMSSPD